MLEWAAFMGTPCLAGLGPLAKNETDGHKATVPACHPGLITSSLQHFITSHAANVLPCGRQKQSRLHGQPK